MINGSKLIISGYIHKNRHRWRHGSSHTLPTIRQKLNQRINSDKRIEEREGFKKPPVYNRKGELVKQYRDKPCSGIVGVNGLQIIGKDEEPDSAYAPTEAEMEALGPKPHSRWRVNEFGNVEAKDSALFVKVKQPPGKCDCQWHFGNKKSRL